MHVGSRRPQQVLTSSLIAAASIASSSAALLIAPAVATVCDMVRGGLDCRTLYMAEVRHARARVAALRCEVEGRRGLWVRGYKHDGAPSAGTAASSAAASAPLKTHAIKPSIQESCASVVRTGGDAGAGRVAPAMLSTMFGRADAVCRAEARAMSAMQRLPHGARRGCGTQPFRLQGSARGTGSLLAVATCPKRR